MTEEEIQIIVAEVLKSFKGVPLVNLPMLQNGPSNNVLLYGFNPNNQIGYKFEASHLLGDSSVIGDTITGIVFDQDTGVLTITTDTGTFNAKIEQSHSVNTVADMNILEPDLSIGELVYITTEDKTYQKKGVGIMEEFSSGNATFNGNRPITRNVTGLTGVNLGTNNVNDTLEALLYPAENPTISLSGGNTREFGSSNSVTLTYTVTKKTYGISTINVNSNNITVGSSVDEDTDSSGSTQIGNIIVTATQNINTTFTSSVEDNQGNTNTSNSTVTWRHKIYWGRHSTFTPPNDAEILALTGASVGTGNQFSTSWNKTYNNINGSGDYLVFAAPTSFGTPSFNVNGLPNSAFTKIRDNSAFINANGYSENYDVWITNTVQLGNTNIIVS